MRARVTRDGASVGSTGGAWASGGTAPQGGVVAAVLTRAADGAGSLEEEGGAVASGTRGAVRHTSSSLHAMSGIYPSVWEKKSTPKI